MKIVLDSGAKMPTRAYGASVGYDLYAMEGQVVSAKESANFNTGVHIELPPNTAGILISKSGLNANHGITSTGLIDPEYVGEIRVTLHNHSGYDYTVEAGDKISQLLIVPVLTPELELVDSLEETERGTKGFGSSGR